MDFVRYLSLLSQYHKTADENKVAYKYARKMEEYYETYIYSVVNDDDSILFGKYSDLYADKKYHERLEVLSSYISDLDLRRSYSSIIDMDIFFFGLIYHTLFKKNNIDTTQKEELTKELSEKITELKAVAKHTKTPSLLKYLRTRVKCSVDIYSKYMAR